MTNTGTPFASAGRSWTGGQIRREEGFGVFPRRLPANRSFRTGFGAASMRDIGPTDRIYPRGRRSTTFFAGKGKNSVAILARFYTSKGFTQLLLRVLIARGTRGNPAGRDLGETRSAENILVTQGTTHYPRDPASHRRGQEKLGWAEAFGRKRGAGRRQRETDDLRSLTGRRQSAEASTESWGPGLCKHVDPGCMRPPSFTINGSELKLNYYQWGTGLGAL